VTVLREVTLSVGSGEFVTVLGANGAGKTSLLKTLANQLHRRGGEVLYEGQPTQKTTPARLARRGLVLVPQGRGLIPFMTVSENLQLGLDCGRGTDANRMKDVFGLFPLLETRPTQRASDLSGGEQQMLALARALLMEPRCLMVDEPSEGLAPKIVQSIFELFGEIRERYATTIVLVEQNVRQALRVADRAYVLERGRVVLEGSSDELAHSAALREAYLGGTVHSAPSGAGER
jgi:branched-chain amino acid transport system ATP-binding protein